MANNNYTFKINVDGKEEIIDLNKLVKETSNTIGGLEKRKEVLTNIARGLDRNSAEFKKLTAELRTTNTQLEQFERSIEPGGLLKFAEGATKLGGAVVGAFGIANVAASTFGESLGLSSDEIEKAELEMQKYLVALQGFQALSEGAQVLPGLYADMRVGITNLTTAFSNLNKVTKASIIGAGIAAVALVVTYWEDISGFIQGSANNLEKLNKKQVEYNLNVINAEKALTVAKLKNNGIDVAEVNLNNAKLKALENEISIKNDILLNAEDEEEINKASVDLANAQLALENERLRQQDVKLDKQEKINEKVKEGLLQEIELNNQISEKTLEKSLFDLNVRKETIEKFENKFLEDKLAQIEKIKSNENINELKKYELIKQLEKQILDEQNLNIAKNLELDIEALNKKFKLEETNLLALQNKRLQDAKTDNAREEAATLNTIELSNFRQAKTKEENDLKLKSEKQIADNIKKLNEDTSLQKLAAVQLEANKYISILQSASAIILSIQQVSINNLKRDIESIDTLIENNKVKIDVINTQLSDLEEQRNSLQEDYNEALVNNNLTALQAIKDENDNVTNAIKEQRKEKAKLEKDNLKQADAKIKKEEEIAKKQAQLAKANAAIQFAQSASSAALAVAQIAVSSSKQDATFGIATVASIVAVLGAVTAAIASAKELGSFAEGGFTSQIGERDETGFRIAGKVHEGEWVAPKWMVDSPIFKSDIDRLESSRRRGFAEGGFTSNNSNIIIQNDNEEVISLLRSINVKQNTLYISELNKVESRKSDIVKIAQT